MSVIADKLSQGLALADGQVVLGLNGYRIGLRSNSHELLEKLGVYFAHTLDAGAPDIEVIAYETPVQDLGLDFIDWKREPGKSGRKDAYVDLEDGRLVQKVRTGMVFLQSETHRIAAGPCLANDNQVINFINAQYMNWLQNNGDLICHASGLVIDGHCLGIAGFSGGGKSTLMLKVLDDDSVQYLTNDRLFIAKDGDGVRATGIPKLPRINPGTIVHNDKLKSILSAEQQDHFLSMPNEELWHIEDKYDVDVEDVYGSGKIAPQAQLQAFLVLNWQRDADTPTRFERVDLSERPELLERAIMKSPGPFYQFPDGSFLRDDMALDPAPYLDVLDGVPIFEVSGTIDFDAAVRFCITQMNGGDF